MSRAIHPEAIHLEGVLQPIVLVGFSNKGCVRGGGGGGGTFFLSVFSLSLSSKRLETSDKARIGSKKIIVERIVGIDLSDEGGVKKKKRKSV